MVTACTSGSCSSPDIGAVLHLGHSGGIGNKLVAVATSLLIALLSNRTVVSLLPQVIICIFATMAARDAMQEICGALDVDAVRSFVAIACRLAYFELVGIHCLTVLPRHRCHHPITTPQRIASCRIPRHLHRLHHGGGGSRDRMAPFFCWFP